MSFTSKKDLELAEGDEEIGAVELKDSASSSRASIEAANTARTVATKVLAVQVIDETGAVMSSAGSAVTIADGADVTQGAQADAKSTATDATPISLMQVLKQISHMAQNPASTPVTGTFYQVTQPVSEAAPASRAVTGTFWPTLGTAAMVASSPVTIASDDVIGLAIQAALEKIDDWEGTGSFADHVKAQMLGVNQAGAAVTFGVQVDTTSIVDAYMGIAGRNVAGNCQPVYVDEPSNITTSTVGQSVYDPNANSSLDVMKGTLKPTPGGLDTDVDNTDQTMKAAAGVLYDINVYNSNAFAVFIHLYDHASPTVGTTVPLRTFFIPPNGAFDSSGMKPITFSTAIHYAATVEATAAATDPTVGLVMNYNFE